MQKQRLRQTATQRLSVKSRKDLSISRRSSAQSFTSSQAITSASAAAAEISDSSSSLKLRIQRTPMRLSRSRQRLRAHHMFRRAHHSATNISQTRLTMFLPTDLSTPQRLISKRRHGTSISSITSLQTITSLSTLLMISQWTRWRASMIARILIRSSIMWETSRSWIVISVMRSRYSSLVFSRLRMMRHSERQLPTQTPLSQTR